MLKEEKGIMGFKNGIQGVCSKADQSIQLGTELESGGDDEARGPGGTFKVAASVSGRVTL